jgi:copper chaperone NosL
MKKGMLFCLALLCVAAVSFAADPSDSASSQRVRCPVCGMFVDMFADWNAEIVFGDSSRAVFDGSKDMFKYYLDMGKYSPSKGRDQITAVSVRDYYSKTPVDALKAFYVIWSDVYGPMGHEPISFEKETDAKRFLKDHKGKKILRFKDVTTKVIAALDNP